MDLVRPGISVVDPIGMGAGGDIRLDGSLGIPNNVAGCMPSSVDLAALIVAGAVEEGSDADGMLVRDPGSRITVSSSRSISPVCLLLTRNELKIREGSWARCSRPSRAYPLMASSLRVWPVDVSVDPLLACHTAFGSFKTSKIWNSNSNST
jgi:hypothetical protein